MKAITSEDLTRWSFELAAAFVCVMILYMYIEGKIERYKRRKKQEQKAAEEAKVWSNEQTSLETSYRVTSTRNQGNQQSIDSSSTYITQIMKDYMNKGYVLGLDIDIFKEHSDIFEYVDEEKIFVSEEILTMNQHHTKVVGLDSYKNNKSYDRVSDRFRVAVVNEFLTRKLGANPMDRTDRIICSYLYLERSNLLKVTFLSKKRDSVNRAKSLGLTSVLV